MSMSTLATREARFGVTAAGEGDRTMPASRPNVGRSTTWPRARVTAAWWCCWIRQAEALG
jgi:hypothetical protein